MKLEPFSAKLDLATGIKFTLLSEIFCFCNFLKFLEIVEFFGEPGRLVRRRTAREPTFVFLLEFSYSNYVLKT